MFANNIGDSSDTTAAAVVVAAAAAAAAAVAATAVVATAAAAAAAVVVVATAAAAAAVVVATAVAALVAVVADSGGFSWGCLVRTTLAGGGNRNEGRGPTGALGDGTRRRRNGNATGRQHSLGSGDPVSVSVREEGQGVDLRGQSWERSRISSGVLSHFL
jgi:hypothetical protein